MGKKCWLYEPSDFILRWVIEHYPGHEVWIIKASGDHVRVSRDQCSKCSSFDVSPSNWGDYMTCGSCGYVWRLGVLEGKG